MWHTADSISCLSRIQEHQRPGQDEQEIFAADDERSLWDHCSVVALFKPQHDVHATLKVAQKILGVQVGVHPGRLQGMHRAEQSFRKWWPPSLAVHCLPEPLALLPNAAPLAVSLASIW